jgi:hypothetical protein
MPTQPLPLIDLELIFLLKIGILTLLVLYVIFSLVIVRQVDLMSRTLRTPISPIVKALAFINAGFSIAFLVLAFGNL